MGLYKTRNGEMVLVGRFNLSLSAVWGFFRFLCLTWEERHGSPTTGAW